MQKGSDCEHLQASWDGWLAGDLEGEGRRELDGHLEACPRCAAQLESLTGLLTEAKALPRAASAARSWKGLARRLEAEREKRRATRRWLEPAALVAAGLALLAGLLATSTICILGVMAIAIAAVWALGLTPKLRTRRRFNLPQLFALVTICCLTLALAHYVGLIELASACIVAIVCLGAFCLFGAIALPAALLLAHALSWVAQRARALLRKPG